MSKAGDGGRHQQRLARRAVVMSLGAVHAAPVKHTVSAHRSAPLLSPWQAGMRGDVQELVIDLDEPGPLAPGKTDIVNHASRCALPE